MVEQLFLFPSKRHNCSAIHCAKYCRGKKPLTLPEVRLLDDGPQYPGVGDDHDDERDEVDGDQEEEGEGGDGAGVGAEGHALLGGGVPGGRVGVPDENLKVSFSVFSFVGANLQIDNRQIGRYFKHNY